MEYLRILLNALNNLLVIKKGEAFKSLVAHRKPTTKADDKCRYEFELRNTARVMIG